MCVKDIKFKDFIFKDSVSGVNEVCRSNSSSSFFKIGMVI